MDSRKSHDSMNDHDGEEFLQSDDATTTVRSGGLADRLSEILVEDADGDLLLQQSDRESNFLQWLQALDLQVMGACRADERLKPLLKMNSSNGAAEDRLLSHLTQHFEATEVGLLARCLCVPLVSIRVGKVVKRGTLLCPASARGNLNLTLLPSSDLRLSFVGDDGHIQRLTTLRDDSECSAVVIDEIPADKSRRSFLIKIPDGEMFYFWCSEKSKLLGNDLLCKMKDLLRTKPTLSDLSGISESRLECFATHLRAYLLGSSGIKTQASGSASATSWMDIGTSTFEPGFNAQSCPISARLSRSRHIGGQPLKGLTQHRGSLSPRSSSFKEGLPRTVSSLRSSSREKLRRCGDLHLPTVDSSSTMGAVLNHSERRNHLESNGSSSASPLNFLNSFEKCPSPPPQPITKSQFPPVCSLFSPYYCWCPPCTSPSITPIPQLPTVSAEPLALPLLSTLLPATCPSSLLSQFPPLDLADGSPLELPALLSDPLTRLSFSKPSLQQIPTFTSLMCDPIVHIPVLDICSSGQAYLVSVGPTMATSIPPLHPKLVGPMIPESESMAEKSARETLRLLIGSSSGHPTSSLMEVLPAVLSNEDKPGTVVTGSRGLYSGTRDVDAMVSSFATLSLVSQSDRSIVVSNCGGFAALDTSGKDFSDHNLQDSAFMPKAEDKDC
ncbi:hypothetical protein Cgig2_032702 [Carnegiea gigantea]|uniref:Uncharacterized protein n=1 Tax=Carnegiea gigantea TaxID=171969 RepID=A0A9Q1QIJ2_9CARY|nr:hypothetical protein Cgig2_032702 [Carnegiea gigantea]